MTRYAFVIDQTRCIGCKACMPMLLFSQEAQALTLPSLVQHPSGLDSPFRHPSTSHHA
ncbi:MAG: 4Fe-4S binding protein [Candidatus Caldarchaeum sp.]|nr:4Fe-4S binding protein [Candidatus Caldarchaeum sp.]